MGSRREEWEKTLGWGGVGFGAVEILWSLAGGCTTVNLLNSHGIVHFRAARTPPHSSQSVNTREQRGTNGCSVPGGALAPSGGPLSTVWQAGLGLLT